MVFCGNSPSHCGRVPYHMRKHHIITDDSATTSQILSFASNNIHFFSLSTLTWITCCIGAAFHCLHIASIHLLHVCNQSFTPPPCQCQLDNNFVILEVSIGQHPLPWSLSHHWPSSSHLLAKKWVLLTGLLLIVLLTNLTCKGQTWCEYCWELGVHLMKKWIRTFDIRHSTYALRFSKIQYLSYTLARRKVRREQFEPI